MKHPVVKILINRLEGNFKMKTLFVTDLDGTLLNRKSEISSESLKIINNLIQDGVYFSYATARSLNSARLVTKGLSTLSYRHHTFK